MYSTESDGKAGGCIEAFVRAKSWLVQDGVDAKGRVRTSGTEDTPTLRGRRTLTNVDFSLFD